MYNAVFAFCWSVILLASSTIGQHPGCPDRCLCFNRESGMVVRCMFVGLTEVPSIPRDTAILDLRFNRITTIKPGAFHGLNSLYTLLLNSNELVEIPSGAFRGLENLKYLYLYKNKIKSLGSKSFSELNKLEQLYAHSNEVESINFDTFEGLVSLKRLFLHNNKIRTIPDGVFNPIKQLSRLRLDSNPLLCNCDLKWLKHFTKNSTNLMEIAATCSEPAKLVGVAVSEVDDKDFNCSSSRSPQNLANDRSRNRIISNEIPTHRTVSRRPQLLSQPQDVQAHPGERAYMYCQAEGDPKPTIAWFHNEKEIVTNDIEPSSRYHILSDGTLMIDNLKVNDQGRYGCMAHNAAGETISGSATLLLETNAIERPDFVLRPRDQTVSLGGSVSLTCTASAGARIKWYKDGQIYTIDPSRSTLLQSGTMLITEVTAQDGGLYKCTATLGTETIHATARVLVREKPYFTEEPEAISVVEGGVAYFNCEAAGYPRPNINWSKNGTDIGYELRTNIRYTISHNSTNLRISDVQLSDAGRFECEASNSLATVSAHAVLSVRRTVPPRFNTKSSTVSAELGADAVLPCSASGDPDPDIRWHRDDQLLQHDEDDDKYQVSSDGTLTINNVTLDDAGTYECQAVNVVGSRSLLIQLQLVGIVEKVYPGDKFVQEAVSTATSEVENAVNQTLRELHNKSKPLSSSDLLALFKFPSQGAQTIARSAEIFERTLELIIAKVHEGYNIKLDDKEAYQDVRDILSPSQIRIVAELSGCAESRVPIDCTSMCFHMKYRSLDGTCNNLRKPMLGSSLTKFSRWLPAEYENNFNLPIGWNTSKLYHGFTKPSARLVSTQIMSSHDIQADDRYSSFLMQWGQFLDHDITLTPMSVSRARFSDGRHCNSTCDNQAPCFPIQTPANDPRLSHRRCLGVTRSSAACGSGMTSIFFSKITHREQINELTAFIDASNVYGSDETYARSLRDLTRGQGQLRTGLLQTSSGKHLLPFNINAPMDCQIDPSKSHIPCFLAGDLRANEQLGLLSMHTLFMREHNRIAKELAKLNKHWDGDMIYHETRKIIGALMQHITYEHWLPKILGPVGMSIMGEYKGYDPSSDSTIMNVFATAAFRFGHTLINPILYRFNSSMQEHSSGHLPLHKAFFAPFRIIEEGGIDPILRGLYGSSAKLPSSEKVFNDELTERLFKLAHAVSLDLAALNIQRGRDHALPSYNTWRKKCGLSEARTFDELANEIPNLKIRMKLEQIYGHPGNIDLFVGGTIEQLMPGARVGPTFMCILAEQFKRLRNGDRFYYESPGVFSPDQLAEIKQATLSHIICMSSDNITQVPKDVFKTSQYPRQYIPCNSGKIAELNLKVWSQCCHNCENSGDFQSITHSIQSRRRRSVNEGYSYPEEKPVTVNTSTSSQSNHIDFRLEGLEDTIELMSEQIKLLVDKIKDLETRQSNCYYMEKEYKEGEHWSTSTPCQTCSCQSGTVRCEVKRC